MPRRTHHPPVVVLALAGLLVSLAACGGTAGPTTPGGTAPGGTAAPADTPAGPADSPTGEAGESPAGSPAGTAAGEPGESPAETAGGTPAPTPGPTAPPGTTEITFWSWVPGIGTQVTAFNESQSEIFVKYLNAGAGDAEYTALRTALETNTDVPDVVQIEYQHLASFVIRDELLDLAQHGANDVRDLFEEWTLAQASQGESLYAYPQDAGPMIMMCNKALLDEHGVEVPTTWDEFTSAAEALHSADADTYLSNFTADQGHWFGLLWQSGSRPFTVDGTTITIDFSSPEVTRVATLWGDLLSSGNVSPIDTYTSDWNAALANRNIACWTAGAWGPSLIESAAPDQAGDWQVYPMPQWAAGEAVNGNYGGSTIAVPAVTAHPTEAEAFARWLTTDSEITVEVTKPPANLFPVTKETLENAEWIEFAPEFWGGQQTHQVMAQAATEVDVDFQWGPFTDFVYTTYEEERNAAVAGEITFEQAMQNVEERSKAYAIEQGFTVP
jgi:multiple sugar transport system substrate-binding protein